MARLLVVFRAAALATGAALIAGAGPAQAHAHLIRSVPAADATVARAPAELELGFSEGVEPAFTGVSVAGPQGAVQTGPNALSPDGLTLAVPLQGTLAPGVYSVTWHALARDGHKTEGRYGFTVRP